jgi:hypothetical protein
MTKPSGANAGQVKLVKVYLPTSLYDKVVKSVEDPVRPGKIQQGKLKELIQTLLLRHINETISKL